MSVSSKNRLYTPSTVFGRLMELHFEEKLLEPVYFLKREDIDALDIEEFRSRIDKFLEDYNLAEDNQITDKGMYLIQSSTPDQELANNLYYGHKGSGMRNLAKNIGEDKDLGELNLISYFSSDKNVLRGVLSHLESDMLINAEEPGSQEIYEGVDDSILIEALQPHTKVSQQELPSGDNDVKKELLKVAMTGRPVFLPYIQNRFNVSKDRVLSEIEKFEINYEAKVDKDLVYFPRPEKIREYMDYREYLENEMENNAKRLENLSFFKGYRNFTELLEMETQGLPDINEFVYSFIDPKNDLAKKERKDFIGDRSKLQQEVNTINRRLNDSRVSNYPVSLNESKKISRALGEIIDYAETNDQDLRIMSPWIDDSSQSFISSLRKAIESGVKVKILMRNGNRYDWRRLTKNFLEKLGKDEENVEIRTYTRFKSDKSKQKIKQDLKDDNRLRDIFGIHGKIYMAGDGKTGMACISSANLMENSLRWNAEAGVLTTSSNVVQPAKEFFDMIWELSETVNPKNITYEDTEFRIPGPYRL